MAAAIVGILGQGAPGAASNSDIYTVPASRRSVISTLVVCNTGATATTFRVFTRPNGAAVGVGNAIVYDAPLGGNTHVALTEGICIDAADVLTVQSAAGGVTFTAYGTEEDIT